MWQKPASLTGLLIDEPHPSIPQVTPQVAVLEAQLAAQTKQMSDAAQAAEAQRAQLEKELLTAKAKALEADRFLDENLVMSIKHNQEKKAMAEEV